MEKSNHLPRISKFSITTMNTYNEEEEETATADADTASDEEGTADDSTDAA